MFKRYTKPDDVGWLGVFVDREDRVIAWVGLDRRVLFIWEVVPPDERNEYLYA